MTAPEDTLDEHEAIEVQFSDYLERRLDEKSQSGLEEHLANCDQCKTSLEDFKKTLEALSGMHKMSVPQTFKSNVEETIHKRSAGRFFGRRAFGDRVPFPVLAAIALLILLGIFAMIWTSDTGSLKPFENSPEQPMIHDGAKDVVPHL